MTRIDPVTVLVVGASIVYVVFALWRHFNRRCEKCGGRMKLDRMKDSMGGNITKKITLSFWEGPRRYTEEWKCKACGDKVVEKHWSPD